MCILLLPALGQLNQLVINAEKHSEEFITAWASNKYKPRSLILISPYNLQYSLPITPNPATLSVYVKKRGPLNLGVLKPEKYFEIEADRGCAPRKHARSNELEDVKSIATSCDPTLAHEDKSMVALPFGAPLTNYGLSIECSFADVAPKITSIEIYFFPPGALSYVAHHCPKLQELTVRIERNRHLPTDILEGLSDISRECKELRGLNVLRLHTLNFSSVLFWEIISRMSCLTHLGVPYCYLVPPSSGSLESQAVEEPAPKRKCLDAKANEETRRAILSLKNVKAIQISPHQSYLMDCRVCYNFSELQFSLAVRESLSVFNNLQYIYLERVEKVNVDCLLSNCKGIQCLSLDECGVSLPEETSNFTNIQQLHLCGKQDFDHTKFANTLGSAVNLTHLSLEGLPDVSVEKVCALIRQLPSLVFLQIIYQHYHVSKSFVREINKEVNIFTKSIERSYLEFHCHLGCEKLDNSDIDRIWL